MQGDGSQAKGADMKLKWKSAAGAAMGVLFGFLMIIPVGHGRALAQSTPKDANRSSQTPPTKTAAEAFKNIKVLKDIPAYELIPTMEFISASLGVHCDYCHVEHHFDEDTKRTKRRAREMMRMMLAIDKDDFHGHQAVTCNTCHHSSPHPAGIPEIAEAGQVQTQSAHHEEHGEHVNLASLPRPEAIVARYVQALGGADSLRKIKSRVMTGTTQFFGHEMPIEIYAKAPDMRTSVMKFPRGQSITIYNGHEGWAAGAPRPPHPLEGSELDQARLEADFYFPLNIEKVFTTLRERPPQKVGDQETYLVLGMRPGKPPVQLYFSKQSGLLLRTVYYTQTALGRLPQRTDYSDYRKLDGVEVPYQWTVARPEGRSTVRVSEIKLNVAISASKFAIPAPAHGVGGRPSM